MNDSNQNICENMTQIQEDLEVLLNKIFDLAGNNIRAEKQAEYTQALEETKQVIERCKIQYNCVIFMAQNKPEIERLYQQPTIGTEYCYIQ